MAAKINGHDYEMEERKGAKFISWEKPGDSISGLLIAIEKVEMTDKQTGDIKPVPRFTLLGGYLDKVSGKFVPNGEEYAFLGTADICQKLRPHDKGKAIAVCFEGVNRDVVKGGNPMKVFRVSVSKHFPEVVGGLKITDEDIPF